MRHLICLGIVLILSLSLSRTVARGEDAPASPPSTSPAAAPDHVVEATDQEALKAAVGETITVRGKVSGIYVPKSGSVLLINFEGANRDFVAVIKKADLETVNAGFEGDVGKVVEGKSILVTGEIKLYKEKPQIEVSKPDQIKIEEEKQ